MTEIIKLPENFIGKEDREKMESFGGHEISHGRATRWHWGEDADGDDVFEILMLMLMVMMLMMLMVMMLMMLMVMMFLRSTAAVKTRCLCPGLVETENWIHFVPTMLPAN